MIIEVNNITDYEIKALARGIIIYRDTMMIDNFINLISLIPNVIVNDKYTTIMKGVQLKLHNITLSENAINFPLMKHNNELLIIDDTITEENIINFLEK